MSTSKFKLRESSDGQFYFTLNAGNGQVLVTSERYTARAGARNGIEAVRDNAVTEPRFNRLVSQDGQYSDNPSGSTCAALSAAPPSARPPHRRIAGAAASGSPCAPCWCASPPQRASSMQGIKTVLLARAARPDNPFPSSTRFTC